MSDTVTLPSGQVITRGRAQALGLLDDDGNIKSSVPADSAAAQVLEQDARRIAWDKQQGIAGELAAIEAERERVRLALGGEPQVTEDGIVKPARKQRVARPRNVTKDGTPVEDEATLAKIAAAAAEFEAKRVAEGLAALAEFDASRAAAMATLEADPTALPILATGPAGPTEADLEADARADEAD